MTLRSLADSRPLRLTFWAAATFAFVMAVVPHPPHIPGAPNDKVQHIIAFATLALLGSWAYTAARPLKLLAWLSLFGALIEIVQAIPSLHRDADVVDWLADTIAVAAVLLLVRAATRRTSA
jgi:VanZ family protein